MIHDRTTRQADHSGKDFRNSRKSEEYVPGRFWILKDLLVLCRCRPSTIGSDFYEAQNGKVEAWMLDLTQREHRDEWLMEFCG